MFVIKLMRASVEDVSKHIQTELIEAERVSVNVIHVNELTEIRADGKSFFISNPNKPIPQSLQDIETWNEAYVENHAGSTTARVKFT